MEVICEYCNQTISDQDEHCPNCGSVNKLYRRVMEGAPSSMEELLRFYNVNFMYPYDITGFYIGENHTASNSFGIYKDGDNFYVYYNDQAGVRTIIYEGTDEVYAVNEMHSRMVERLEVESSEKLDYVKKERATIRKQIIDFLAVPLACILMFVLVAIWAFFAE